MMKIGVTGHRNLNIRFIDEYKQIVFNKLLKLKQQHQYITMYSALADGADRLAVYQAIKLDIEFTVVLPMEQNIYKIDFDINSKIEFNDLLKKSKNIVTIPIKQNQNFKRDLQYELAGRYISDNCDMLFALWNGSNTNLQGGTSEIVKYYKLKKDKIIYHIKVDRKYN